MVTQMYQDDNSNEVTSESPETAESGTSAPASDEQAAADPAGRPDLTASFLAEIARAMRATAIQERERISTTVADSTVAHEQKVRDRAASEANELRKLADGDVERIEQTAADEIQRIQADAERQVGDRRSELTNHLERHAALIETEVGRIRGAVDDYGAELDGFFGRLAEEQDPAEIARLAGMLPEPPDLDQVGADARADAVGQIAAEAAEAEAEAVGAEAAGKAVADAGQGWDTGAPPPASKPTLVPVMDNEPGTPVFDDSAEPADAEAVPAGAIAEDEPNEAASAPDVPHATGISAARLLRSLAPWTSPDRPSDDNPDSPTAPGPG